MSTKSIGKYVAEFVANTSGFRTPVRATTADLGQLEAASSTAITMAGVAGTAIGASIAAIGVGLAALTKQAISTAAEIGEMSDRTGMTVQQMSAYRVGAELAKMSTSELETGIRRMQQSMTEAGKQTKTATETGFKYFSNKVKDVTPAAGKAESALQQLGLSMAEIRKLSEDPAKAVEAITERLDKVQNKSKRASLAEQIFGSTKFLNLAPMKELLELAGKEHQIFSEKDVADAIKFEQSMVKLRGSIQGIFNVLIQDGRLEEITKLLERAAEATGKMAGNLNTIIDNMPSGAGSYFSGGASWGGVPSMLNPITGGANQGAILATWLANYLTGNKGGARTEVKKAMGGAK